MTTLAVLEERVKSLREDLQSKHQQNRGDIHKIKDELQTLNEQIWLLKLKIAGYAGGGSAIAVALEQLIKWLIHH